MNEKNPIVYLNLKIGQEKVGRVVIELFKDQVPKTVENFRALCVGDSRNGKILHYKGTVFHRIVSQCMIQGGDVTNFNGVGGDTIFGPCFELEKSVTEHNSAGLLGTVAHDDNKSNSQFIITTTDCPHLNGISVVFGKVLKGLACVLQVSNVKTLEDGSPVECCVIEDCGEIKDGEDWRFIDDDETTDHLPPDPVDSGIRIHELGVNEILQIISSIRHAGNYFFSRNKVVEAHRKYNKAVRYISWVSCCLPASKLANKDVEIGLEKERLLCLLNLSATNFKKFKFREALALCDEILAKDRNNVKALFRRGKALLSLNDYEEALATQKAAQMMAPNDKTIAAEIERIHKTMHSYLLEEKRVYSKMFTAF